MKKPLLTLFFLVLSFAAFAQKDAPIAGNSATLIDLLKKNYQAIDPDVKDEEIARDRTQVISIFKSYLEDGVFAASLSGKPIPYTDVELKLKEYNAAKKQLLVYSTNPVSLKVTIHGETKIEDIDLIKKASMDVDSSKTAYYTAKYNFDTLELARLIDLYSSNLFISEIVTSFSIKYNNLCEKKADPFAGANYTSSLQKSIPFIGGSMGFETYMDGLARFLAKRIKDELTTYAIENIKQWLENPSANDPLAEFKVIMPRTTNFIKNFNADRLTSFPNEVRQYIADDLNHILENAAKLKVTPRTARLIAQNPNLEFAFDALKIIPALSNIKYPIDYFKLLENSETLRKWENSSTNWEQNIISSVKMANLIANSMIVMENDEPRFAGSSFLSSYASEGNFYKLYTGFLHQQNLKYYNISFANHASKPQRISDLLKKLVCSESDKDLKIKGKIESLITNIGTSGEKVYTTALEIRQAKKSSKKIGADTIFTFVKSVIDLSDKILQSGGDLANELVADDTLKLNVAAAIDNTRAYFKMASIGNEIVYDLQKRQFASSLTKTLQLCTQLVPDTKLSRVSELITQITNLQPDQNIQNWHVIATEITDTQSNSVKELKKKFQNPAGNLARELNSIKNFYLVNYIKDTRYTSTIAEIDSLRKLLFQISILDTNGIMGLKAKAKAFMANKDFQLLIVSFYTNTAIDQVASKIETEINAFKIDNKPLFLVEQSKAFKQLIIEYGMQTYYNYVTQGHKEKKEKKLLENQKNLDQFVANLVFNLPQRTDLTINPKVIAMINFVNGMATAEDAEGVQKAIEAFALPTGSYSVKRKSLFNVSLNSYPGILSALDVTWKDKTVYAAPSFGFTAPFGLSLTWGNQNESSHGIYIPVIDIGALTRFRLDDNSATKALPELKFSNVFSPGLYYHYDFKKSPFTIYFGGQYGPELREVTSDSNNIQLSKNYESARFGVGLVLDIPLLNIYTKSRL